MAFFKKGEAKLLLPFYIERFISILLYFAPAFWILQFQQNFSLSQVGLLFGISSLSSFIFEIPTGAFADVYGRKMSTLVGYFMTGLIVISIYFTKNFYFLILLFILCGLSGTFISGARESWVIDKLKASKKSNLIHNFYVKEASIVCLSLFFSGILGTLLVPKFGLDIIWLFAGFSFIVSGVLLSFISESRIKSVKNSPKESIFVQAKKSLVYAWKHHILFFLLTATFFIMFRDGFGGDLVWQPFLKSLGFPISGFGIMFSLIALGGSFMPFLAGFLSKKFSSERVYLIALIVLMIVLDILVFSVNNYFYGIILFFLMVSSFFLFYPISAVYFQKHIPSHMRATITSINGMVIALSYTISMPLSGLIAENIGPKYTIVLGSIFLIPALILYTKIKDKK